MRQLDELLDELNGQIHSSEILYKKLPQTSKKKTRELEPLNLTVPNIKLNNLFQYLISKQAIDKSTNLNEFIKVFSGNSIPENFEKIICLKPTIIAILIGEFIDSPKKWVASQQIFENSQNFKILHSKSRTRETFDTTMKNLDNILKH